ncbi:hypothetical protein AB0F18_24290 [Streptomyces sp. NPDC029216]
MGEVRRRTDTASCRVTGWATPERLGTGLAADALTAACRQRAQPGR